MRTGLRSTKIDLGLVAAGAGRCRAMRRDGCAALVEHRGTARPLRRQGLEESRLSAHAPFRASAVRVRRRSPSVRECHPPDAATFWRLSDEAEEAFDARWEGCLDDATTWTPFFKSVAALESFRRRRRAQGPVARGWRRHRGGRPGSSSPTAKKACGPGPFDLGRGSVTLLALGTRTRRQGRPPRPISPARKA